MHLLLFAWGFLSTKEEEPSVAEAEGGNSEKSWTNRGGGGGLLLNQKSKGGILSVAWSSPCRIN